MNLRKNIERKRKINNKMLRNGNKACEKNFTSLRELQNYHIKENLKKEQ